MINNFFMGKEGKPSNLAPLAEQTYPDDMSFGILESLHGFDTSLESILQDMFYSNIVANQRPNISYVSESYSVLEENELNQTRERIVKEGFGDFMKGFGEIIKAFIQKIKDAFQRIRLWLLSRTTNIEKFIKENRSELLKFDGEFETELVDFKIDDTVPDLFPLRDIIQRYNNEIRKISSMTLEEVEKNAITLGSDDYLNTVRGELLQKGPISLSMFQEEIRRVFTNQSPEGRMVKINSSTLRMIIDQYTDLHKYRKKFEIERKRTIDYLNQLEKFFKQGASLSVSSSTKQYGMAEINGDDLSSFQTSDSVYAGAEHYDKISIFYSAKAVEARDLLSSILLVLNGKANAIRDNLIQYERVVKQSTSMIRKKVRD